MNTSLSLLNRNLQLHRYPQNLQHPSWQAWDAADEYLIEHVETQIPWAEQGGIRLYNDDFGALACWFSAAQPSSVSDSYIARQASEANLKKNDIAIEKLSFFSSVQELDDQVSLVLLKIPKTTALLEQQLIDLQKVVSSQTKVIAAAKANMIQKSTLALFEKYLGPTTTSLAKKKARLIFCQPTGDKSDTSPYPTVWQTESPRFNMTNLANVFARQQLDIGARFVLQHLSKLPSFADQRIIDLGCGNGVLGLHLLHQNQQSQVTFVDESHMAVASAKQNVLLNLPKQFEQCEFLVNNCLDDFKHKSAHVDVDTIVCNPPFHQQNTITDHIAWQMFKDAKGVLKKGGELYVVGNRHLDYPKKLIRLFGRVNVVASNQKFNILSATKS